MIAPEAMVLPRDARVPNSRLPVLVYRSAGPRDAAGMLALFAAHDWRNGWRNGIYPFHHFHSSAHEVLGIAGGQVTVRLGGDSGRNAQLRAGDVVVLPAGTGHKRLASDGDLDVVGAYPGGSGWDLIRADDIGPSIYERALATIMSLPLPDADPVYGRDGPLRHLWT